MARLNPIDVQAHLGGMEYPTDKETLLSYAREQGADDQMVRALGELGVEQFQTPADVSRAIGELDSEDVDEDADEEEELEEDELDEEELDEEELDEDAPESEDEEEEEEE